MPAVRAIRMRHIYTYVLDCSLYLSLTQQADAASYELQPRLVKRARADRLNIELLTYLLTYPLCVQQGVRPLSLSLPLALSIVSLV